MFGGIKSTKKIEYEPAVCEERYKHQPLVLRLVWKYT